MGGGRITAAAGAILTAVGNVLETVREQLEALRAGGMAFDDAWGEALDQVVADPDWAAALAATREGWWAAYERRVPRRAQRALHAVATDPDRESLPADVSGSSLADCAHCGATLPPQHSGRRRLYCSGRCRRRAHVWRAAAAA